MYKPSIYFFSYFLINALLLLACTDSGSSVVNANDNTIVLSSSSLAQLSSSLLQSSSSNTISPASSSSMFLSSSSVAFVSSSSAPVLSSSLSRVGYGVFTDSRDGQEYRYVSIGDQVWMAENLRYLPQVDFTMHGSEDVADGKYYYVYDYVPSGASEAEQVANAKATTNYQSYGVLYNWNAAMDGALSSGTTPSGVQGVCPEGWHLPSDGEWTELSDFVDLDNDGEATNDNEGTSLKSTMGWNSDGNGTDAYGFSALPGGYRYDTGNNFDNVGIGGYWWSTTEGYSSGAYRRLLNYGNIDMLRSSDDKNNGYSVRCLQD